MPLHTCLYCKGTKVGKEYDPHTGVPTGRITGCVWCNETGTQEFRFDTVAEMMEWQKTHPTGVLYRGNQLWLGCCREDLEIYLESHETGIDYEDIYDKRHGILRFEI